MLLTYECMNTNCRNKFKEIEIFTLYEKIQFCPFCSKQLDHVISIPTVELKTDGFCNRINE